MFFCKLAINIIIALLKAIAIPSREALVINLLSPKKINPKVKIIAVSGLTASDKFTAVASAGINTFLSKPYTAKELLQNINEVLKPNRESNRNNINLPFVQLP